LPLPVAIWMRARRLLAAEGALEVTDGFDLRGPEVTFRHLIGGRKIGESGVKLRLGLDPLEQSLGFVKREDVAALR